MNIHQIHQIAHDEKTGIISSRYMVSNILDMHTIIFNIIIVAITIKTFIYYSK